MSPISLDSSLANVPGSKGEDALNVSESGRAGPGEQPRKVLRAMQSFTDVAAERCTLPSTRQDVHHACIRGNRGTEV